MVTTTVHELQYDACGLFSLVFSHSAVVKKHVIVVPKPVFKVKPHVIYVSKVCTGYSLARGDFGSAGTLC
jgi:hypothetical protein